MRATRVVGVGAVLAAAVGAAWYLAALSTPVPPATPQPAGTGRMTRQLPPPVAGFDLAVLPHLHPGMSRTDVEDLLGSPDPARLQPVDDASGRATYQTEYPLALVGGGTSSRLPPPVGPQSFVRVEFDATLPGHPLINVRYSDPLF